MAQFPALPLWTDAYLGDTTHLTTIEHGAYLLLLIVAWRSPDCRLPNDDKMLARFTKLSPSQWKRIKPIIMEFFTIRDEWIYQLRLLDELEAVKRLTMQRSNAGKSSALKRKERNQRAFQREANETATPTPRPIKKDIDKSISKEKRKKSQTEIPENWQPNAKALEIGFEENYSPEEIKFIAQTFIDSAHAKGTRYVEWNTAFYKWLRSGITRSDVDRKRTSKNSNGGKPGNKGIVGIGNKLASEIRARDNEQQTDILPSDGGYGESLGTLESDNEIKF